VIYAFGVIANIAGGLAGGLIGRTFPLNVSLWTCAILQAAGVLLFSLQAVLGHNTIWLVLSTTAMELTGGIGSVIFVAYLSALCCNPRHTATQYALLVAIASAPRNVFSVSAGYVAKSVGWVSFFAVCAATAIPSLGMLAVLQRGRHFEIFVSRKNKG
jgi:MFS transporter, PAT family, beta-lactamase induction signal transducer AmpG